MEHVPTQSDTVHSVLTASYCVGTRHCIGAAYRKRQKDFYNVSLGFMLNTDLSEIDKNVIVRSNYRIPARAKITTHFMGGLNLRLFPPCRSSL